MNVLLTFLMLLLAFSSFGQNKLQTPKIDYVTVDTATGRPIIGWSAADSENVEGFIVKRLIVDGVGVVSGTFNNVAVIERNDVFSWIDNSTDYSTMAKPSQRIEYYCVSSYVTIDGQKYYSLMSEPCSTMLLNVEYNQCSDEYNFLWNSSLNTQVDYYVLHSSQDNSYVKPRFAMVKDTSYVYKFDKFIDLRRFTVECVLKNGFSEFSPIVDFEAEQQIAPKIIEISNVSVNDDGKIELTFNASENKYVSKYFLIRNNVDIGVSDTLAMSFLSVENFLYVDTTADVSVHYNYVLAAVNSCATVFGLSNTAGNIVFVAEKGDGNINNLEWNNISILPQDIDNVDIMRSIDGEEYLTIYSCNAQNTNYSDVLSNIIANREKHLGSFCYQLCLTSMHGDTAFSNIACVSREPVIYIPNALNPNSSNSENWTFRPKADFLDDYKLTIYDKRGAIIFSSQDIFDGWDGRNGAGKLYPPDTYVYLIVYSDSMGKKHKLSGFVNLVY